MTEETSSMIANWLASNSQIALMLPDGWFGMPRDFRYSSTFFVSRPHKIILELNNQMLLTFTDLSSAEIECDEGREGKKLLLSGYMQVTFQWQNSETDRPLPEFRADNSVSVQIYRAGTVAFVAF